MPVLLLTPAQSVGFSVTVAGVDISAYVEMSTFSVESSLADKSDLCSFTVIDPAGTVSVSGKQDVLVQDSAGTVWFGGKVATVDRDSDTTVRIWSVQAHGYYFDAVTTMVNKVYQATTDVAILADLFASYRPDWKLQPTTVSNSIDHISFPQMTLADALKNLGDTTGMVYWMDAHRGFHWIDPSQASVAYAFSDSPDGVTTFAYQNAKVKEDATQVTNRVTVIGGIYLSQPQTDTFTADGRTTVFTLSARPYSVDTITVAGVAQSFGNLGTDQYGGTQGYVVLKDDPTQRIVFQAAPAQGAAISVKHTHQQPVLVRVANLASYQYYGNTWYDGKITDQSIQAVAAAAARGGAQLARHSYSQLIAQFDTRLSGRLYSGQGITFQKTVDGVSGTFVLTRTHATYAGGGVLIQSVEATGGLNDIPEAQETLSSVILGLVQDLQATPQITQGTLDDYIGPVPDALSSGDSMATVSKAEPYTWGGASSVWGFAQYKLWLATMPTDTITASDSAAGVSKTGPYTYGPGGSSAIWGYAQY